MNRKGVELSPETKELIVTLSESVKNKAEKLNISRKTIRHSGDFDANWREKSLTIKDRNALNNCLKVKDDLPYKTLLQS